MDVGQVHDSHSVTESENGSSQGFVGLPIHPEHLKDLLHSGLSIEMIKEVGIHSVTPRFIPKHLGFNDQRITSVLCFPYPAEPGFCRDKIFPTNLVGKDGHKMRYLQRKGSGCKLYIPPLAESVREDPTVPLYFTEGEKKAAKACQEGYPCIGLGGLWNFTNNGELLPDFARITLEGRDIFLVPDSEVWVDRKDLVLPVNRLGVLLKNKGARVWTLPIPQLAGEKKVGLDDFLVAGGKLEDLKRVPLSSLNFTIAPKQEEKRKAEQRFDDELAIRPYSDIEERETTWLWYPYLPAGSVVSLEGNPGEGKSWVTLSFATSVSLGHWPFSFSDARPMKEQEGRDLGEPAAVLHINVEDSPEETIRKRLRNLGADCARVFLIEGVQKPLKDGTKVVHFTIDNIPPLERKVHETGARLVIIDPIQAYLPRGADMNKAESVRTLISALIVMARRTGCTVLLVLHLGKRLTETSIYKAIGSIDFAAALRSVLMVGLLPNQSKQITLSERGVLTHAKSNLAPRGVSLEFELKQDQFLWTGQSEITATDLTSPKPQRDEEEEQTMTREVMDFLQEILSTCGSKERAELIAEGKKLGFSDRTLDRAARKLGVKKTPHYKDGKVAGSTWELPAK